MLVTKVLLSIFVIFLNLENLEAGDFDRIVGGASTPIYTVPYQIVLQPMGCGGSILTSRWLITAAHCTVDYTAAQVKFAVGVEDLRLITKRYDVIQLVVHPNYNKKTTDNDIALIKSYSPIVFSLTVQPITIAKVSPPDGAMVRVSGFGRTSFTNPNLSDTLLSVELQILNINQCRSMLYLNTITDNMLCAYKPLATSCMGDSGGPLTYNKELVGLVSWGIDCESGLPSMYTKVANYISWIDSYLRT